MNTACEARRRRLLSRSAPLAGPGCTPVNRSTCPEPTCIAASMRQGYLKSDGSALTVSVRGVWDSTTPEGFEWVKAGRGIVHDANNNPNGLLEWCGVLRRARGCRGGHGPRCARWFSVGENI